MLIRINYRFALELWRLITLSIVWAFLITGNVAQASETLDQSDLTATDPKEPISPISDNADRDPRRVS
ncbi:MAG: hypothetical protein ACRD6I_14875, partial [Candidatus Acidiferrales bacterium]